MIKQKLTALTLAGFLAAAAGSAFAGSTGPTNPVDKDNGLKSSSDSENRTTNGEPTGSQSSLPGKTGPGTDNGNGSSVTGGKNSGMSTGGSGGGEGGAGGGGTGGSGSGSK